MKEDAAKMDQKNLEEVIKIDASRNHEVRNRILFILLKKEFKQN